MSTPTAINSLRPDTDMPENSVVFEADPDGSCAVVSACPLTIGRVVYDLTDRVGMTLEGTPADRIVLKPSSVMEAYRLLEQFGYDVILSVGGRRRRHTSMAGAA